MCSIPNLLKLRQKGAALLSREAVQTQDIDDPFLWLDALLFGIQLAKHDLDPTEFFQDLPSRDSKLLSLVEEGYELQLHTTEEEQKLLLPNEPTG